MTKIKFNSYLKRSFPSHSPQKWDRWWKFISFSFINLTMIHLPTTGYRLWVYSRWGAIHFDIVFDRRNKK